MKWFLDLSTRQKLLLGFGIMIVLLAIVMFTAYTNIRTIQNTQTRIYEEDFANALALKEIRTNQNAIRENQLIIILSTDRAEHERRFSDIEERSRKNDQHLRGLMERMKSNPSLYPRLEEFLTIRTPFAETRNTRILPLLRDGKMDEAKQLILGVQAERNEKMRVIADALIEEVEKTVAESIRLSGQKIEQLAGIFVFTGLLALAISILMIYLMNRAIAGPLGELTTVAGSISEGDLAATLGYVERRDEVGALAQSFSRMTLYLRGMADIAERIAEGDIRTVVKPQSEKDTLGRAVANMADSLRQVNREIQESANILVSAATEIMSSTTEVASSVSETATAVTQTTSTVEEVKQTTMVSTQKAQYVSDTAQKAAQVSQTGTKAVGETIDKMNLIREQMEAIAASIVKLSEQSQAIGEIIATVNDLAEQSNLLAVNASIEAAKAGEHGKGFAVVAQEVRSLAEQSKQATAQVRSLLNDIQKATGSAVLATEQGSKTVDAGVKQSAEAGESIRNLAASIAEAAQAASQITASSRQQLTGVEQIISAMDNIRLASEQNVAGTRQSETAAHNLHDLGQKLKELIGRYKV
jgi:methyl-accepting chemotaxis protein